MRMKPCVARVGEGWDSIVTVREPDHTHQNINSNTQTYLGVVGVVVEGRAAALDLHGGQVRRVEREGRLAPEHRHVALLVESGGRSRVRVGQQCRVGGAIDACVSQPSETRTL